MSAGIRTHAAKRPRRKQADRTAETRRRVIDAVVECVAELGYPRTTGTEIAHRAGVSWGGIQHHFGDKNGILAAALEESFRRFAATLGEPPAPDTPLEARVRLFIDRAWQHFGSEQYRTTFQILLNLPPEMESWWTDGVLATWQDLWRRYFPESPLGRRETADLTHYAVSLLTGLATTAMLEPGPGRAVRPCLARLENTLVRELSPPSPLSPRGGGR